MGGTKCGVILFVCVSLVACKETKEAAAPEVSLSLTAKTLSSVTILPVELIPKKRSVCPAHTVCFSNNVHSLFPKDSAVAVAHLAALPEIDAAGDVLKLKTHLILEARDIDLGLATVVDTRGFNLFIVTDRLVVGHIRSGAVGRASGNVFVVAKTLEIESINTSAPKQSCSTHPPPLLPPMTQLPDGTHVISDYVSGKTYRWIRFHGACDDPNYLTYTFKMISDTKLTATFDADATGACAVAISLDSETYGVQRATFDAQLGGVFAGGDISIVTQTGFDWKKVQKCVEGSVGAGTCRGFPLFPNDAVSAQVTVVSQMELDVWNPAKWPYKKDDEGKMRLSKIQQNISDLVLREVSTKTKTAEVIRPLVLSGTETLAPFLSGQTNTSDRPGPAGRVVVSLIEPSVWSDEVWKVLRQESLVFP